jgi:hypothetical protein
MSTEFRGSPVSKQMKMNFLQSLVAVLVGNLIYFLAMPYLPPAAQHRHLYDLGVVVDFWVCLVVFGLIKTISSWRQRSRSHEREQPH